jgi:F-type H+-transporting ATPase subunit epsilon
MANDKLLEIEIVTPQKTVFSGNARSITLPGTMAPFQVLYNHAPIVSSLELGQIKIVDENDNEIFYATSHGFTEVSRNVVSVLVETAENAADIDSNKVSKLIEDLEKQLKDADKIEAKTIKRQIEFNKNKLKVAGK